MCRAIDERFGRRRCGSDGLAISMTCSQKEVGRWWSGGNQLDGRERRWCFGMGGEEGMSGKD
jgi:hypothetical protein